MQEQKYAGPRNWGNDNHAEQKGKVDMTRCTLTGRERARRQSYPAQSSGPLQCSPNFWGCSSAGEVHVQPSSVLFYALQLPERSRLSTSATMKILKRVSAAALLLASNLPAHAQQGSYPLEDEPPKLGAVACESSVCSRIGTDLLKQGGNAVDAIVGAVLCVGTVGM